MTSKNNGKKPENVTIPQPYRVSVGETADGLVEIEIQLRKYRLSVVEANGFTRFKMNSLVSELLKEFPEANTYESQVQRNLLTEVWVPLSVCSHGEVPTKEQFFGLPAGDIAFWVNTAKELGHEFLWYDGLNEIYRSTVEQVEADKEDLKKKNRQPDDHPEIAEVPAE